MHVFISYSHTDTTFADKLTKSLEQAGYEVWLDSTDIQTGTRWDDEIVKGLNSSETFLVLLSNKATASQNVKDEIGYALDHGKQILPILLEPCDIPFRLRRVQYVDFTALEFTEGTRKILTILKSFNSNKDGTKEIKQEKLMDPTTLATAATSLLAPYLAKLGESFMEEAGARLPDKVGKVWETIVSRFKGNPTASSVANDLVKKADEPDNQDAFVLQLKKVLKEDEWFAATLQSILKEAQGQVSNIGDGAVATNGSIGVGKIEVGGNLSGNITIGSNNLVNENRSNRKKK
ncbi:hypothetical protein ANAEL_01423 [Anaerolineales bacterium]|nr:hypothetical protein ANAEL_01423 [Anaerolineales bacterium]